MGNPLAGQRHNRYPFLLAGLEPHRRTRRNAEPESKRLLAVELERMIGLKEMTVGADLNRPITCIRHQQLLRRTTGVRLNITSSEENLARHDRFGQLSFDHSSQGAPFLSCCRRLGW